MMAADTIREEPFAVINADDFYGAEAYKTIADYLRSVAAQRNHYCMVGYELKNTLSDYGSVSRGICSVDSNGNLTSMVERTKTRSFTRTKRAMCSRWSGIRWYR